MHVANKSPKYLSRSASIVVRPAPGWLDLVDDELHSLLANPLGLYKFQPEIKKDKGAVVVRNIDFRQALEWCMRAKTVHDIEWLAWDGKCKSWADLAGACEALNDFGFIDKRAAKMTVRANASFVISSTVIKNRFLAAAGLSEDADSHLDIRLDLYRDRLKILISLPGAALYKRGYKRHLVGANAPMPEHQGAACIIQAWREIRACSGREATDHTSLMTPDHLSLVSGAYVPFAGTGTLAFEWALLASQTQLVRDFFAFEEFASAPERTIAHMKRKIAANGAKLKLLGPIVCLERDASIVDLLRDNVAHFAERTGARQIDVLAGDFFKSSIESKLRELFPAGSNVLVFLNPPYGKRLKNSAESKLFFRRIAEHLIDLEIRTELKFSGFCLIPEEPAALAWVRVMRRTHTTKTSHFSHGGIDMRLVSFCSRHF